ncbi:MAG: ISLre2 family transposase [Actinomycetota bacterium]
MENIIGSICTLIKEGVDCKQLEKEVFEFACKMAGNIFSQALQLIDEALLKQKDKDLCVVGFREKTIEMLFGRLTIKRRLYRDSNGSYRFLLDEALGLNKSQRISPTLAEAATVLVTHMPFRKVSEVIGLLLPTHLSHMMIYNHFEKVAEVLDEQDERRANNLFENGVIEHPGTKVSEKLFVEADGLFVHLQRENKRKAELKLGVSYEGLASTGSGRHKTVGKIAVAGMLSSKDFWQRFSERLCRSYDVGEIRAVYIGGDGASWIKGGCDLFKHATFTLDRFHLNREIMRSLPAALHAKAIDLASQADMEGLDTLFSQATANASESQAKRIKKARAYIFANKDGLKKELPERALGTMEGQIDKTLAHRFKKRGMSWTLSGAHRMAHMLCLRENGELFERLQNCHIPADFPAQVSPKSISLPEDPGKWLRASLPALTGPHGSRPWVATLRGIAGLGALA